MKGGGVRAYAAPDLAQTVIAVESGFAGSTTNEAFYDSQDGVTKEDYEWGGTLDEFE
ncbi:MAG: hypothetical protein ACLRZL_01740 [Alistipes communis]